LTETATRVRNDQYVGPRASVYHYNKDGEPGGETVQERERRERFWRSLGRKIRAGR
jgi:hypothetical protein